MSKYFIRRIFSAFITLFFIMTITFFMMKSIPGGPFSTNDKLSEEVRKALEAKYHLDDPLMKQYFDYVKGVVRFDLGPSFQRAGYTVNQLIAEGFPISAKIGGVSVIFVLILGIPFGIISALKQNKLPDKIIGFLSTLGVCIPAFVIGTLFIYVFCFKFNMLPSHGLESWKSYIGPVIALSGFSLATIVRLTKSSMLEVIQQDYIRTARAKGLSKTKVIYKHALKNSLIPVVTYVGPMIASILTGSFVVEKIFAIPGMGKHFTESVNNRDYTVLMGCTIFYALIYVVMVLIVDIIYVFIDPRIKYD